MDAVLFDETDTRIIRDIRDQASQVCRHKISDQWIRGSLSDFSFGYAIRTPVATVGKMRITRKTEHRIRGFVLCKVYYPTKNLEIKLVCSRNKGGKMLVELAEEKAREIGMTSVSLLSLPDKNLVGWYKGQGFRIVSEIHDHTTYDLKSYYLSKDVSN
jgi:hypothetical protein